MMSAEFGEDKDDGKSGGGAAVAPRPTAGVARRDRRLAGRDAPPSRHGGARRRRREHRRGPPPGQILGRPALVRQYRERPSGENQDRRDRRLGSRRDSA